MRKYLLGLLLVVLLCFSPLLVSCQQGIEGAGEDLEVLSTDVLKDKDNPVTVEFWHSFGHNVTTALEEILEIAEESLKQKGYNIKVNVVAKGGGYDNLRSQVNLGTKSNSIPTMILGYPDHFADYINNGILLPLDEFVYSENKEIALEGVEKNGANDFVASYWAENQMLIKGKTQVAGIPFNKSTEIMVYNSNVVDPILQQNGWLSANGKWENPTWEQVFTVSQAIVANKSTISYQYNGATYKVDAGMKYPTYVDSAANFFITTSRQWGGEGKYTTVDAEGKGTVTAKNAATQEAMTYFKQKADAGLFQFPDKVNQSYGSNLLQNLQAFISIGSTAGIKNNASQKYYLKATGIPQKGYGENDTQAVIQQGTNLAILSQNSNNKTRLAAWMLIKELVSTENSEKFSKNSGYLPVRESSRNTDTYKAFLANEDDVFDGAVARAINAAFKQKDYFYTDPAFTSSSIVRDRVGTAALDIFIYNKTFDQAMDSFYSGLKKLGIKVQE